MSAWLWRRLPWLAALGFAVACGAYLANDPHLRHEVYPAYSSLNASAEGLSGAAAYLRARGRVVDVLTRPLTWERPPANAVVLRIAPASLPMYGGEPPARKGADEEHGVRPPRGLQNLFLPGEEDWLRSGGRLVLALEHEYGPLRLAATPDGPCLKTFPVWPGVERLEPQPLRALEGPGLDGMETLWARGDAPVVARLRIGNGELIALACPNVFQNGGLARADHLRLLEELAAAGRPVRFDEFAHGLHAGAGGLELLRYWGYGPLLLLLAVCVALGAWRGRTRLGPPDRTYRETRNVTVGLLESLAPLYGAALSRREALVLYHKAFVQEMVARTGLKGAALAKRIQDLGAHLPPPAARDKRDVDAREFNRNLSHLNEAFQRMEHEKRR